MAISFPTTEIPNRNIQYHHPDPKLHSQVPTAKGTALLSLC
uniref:Uncharacterized protein n=1 Tax=Setaria italica TaxID=4555 RepID=K3XUE7_SETIT